jgi:hypothetical protein
MNTLISGLEGESLAGLSGLRNDFNDHINDINNADAPHITAAEREEWNKVSSFPTVPVDSQRYVMKSNDYVPAYEQTIVDPDEQSQSTARFTGNLAGE